VLKHVQAEPDPSSKPKLPSHTLVHPTPLPFLPKLPVDNLPSALPPKSRRSWHPSNNDLNDIHNKTTDHNQSNNIAKKNRKHHPVGISSSLRIRTDQKKKQTIIGDDIYQGNKESRSGSLTTVQGLYTNLAHTIANPRPSARSSHVREKFQREGHNASIFSPGADLAKVFKAMESTRRAKSSNQLPDSEKPFYIMKPQLYEYYQNCVSSVIKVQYTVKRWLAKRKCKQLRERSTRAKELLDSESNYIDSLEIVIENFLKPLKSNQKVLSRTEAKIIFSEIEVIKNYNKRLLAELQKKNGQLGIFSDNWGCI